MVQVARGEWVVVHALRLGSATAAVHWRSQTDSNRVKVLSVTTGVMLTVDKNLRMTMSMRGIENWVKPSQKTFVY